MEHNHDKEVLGLVERIKELRTKILIHSYLYWYKDNPMVSDTLFDNWKINLVHLQKQFSEDEKFKLIKIDFFDSAFTNWDGKNSKALPLFDDWVVSRVDMLDKYKNATPYFNI